MSALLHLLAGWPRAGHSASLILGARVCTAGVTGKHSATLWFLRFALFPPCFWWDESPVSAALTE